MSKLYTERDIIEQGDYYSRHTSAMTGEGLDRKSDIAAELAHRDIQIDQLQARVAELEGEQLEVWLGSGDKLVADIYADDGGWAGVGIFNPPNGKTQGIGEKDDQIDGMSLDKNKAIILIKSTRPESLQVVVEELQEAMAKMGYTHPASAAKQAVSVPSILYDGYAVFQEVQHARNSKGLENIKDSALVSDVLDAVVKLIKQEQDDE